MSINELFVLCHPKKGTMIGRLAFKTREAAEEYIKSRPTSTIQYRLERYLPAPVQEVKSV